jgi:pimeloyl-ACP methyl ester carboxylesterase
MSIRNPLPLLSLTLLMASLASAGKAEQVTIEHNGLTLNANLELAEERRLSDGVVLIIHGFLAHNRMEIIETSQTALRDNGQSSLAINLSLGVDNRQGFYDCMTPIRFKLSDALGELDAWIAWLKDRGTERVVLMGHSMSANQVLAYAVSREEPAIAALVLLAPNTVGRPSSRERYKEVYDADLDTYLARATDLIDSGNGDRMMRDTDYGFCPKAEVTAEAFYDFYRPDNTFWNAHLSLPRTDVPVLVVAASADEQQPNIPEHVEPYVDGERVFLIEIEGAGHFFRDLDLDEAVEAAVSFIDELERG